MDTNQFSQEWDLLKERGRQLANDVQKLKLKLSSLAQDPEMSRLITEKRGLRGRAAELSRDLSYRKNEHEECQGSNRRALAKRRLALTDARIRNEIAIQLKSRRDRLAKLESFNAPEVIIGYERGLVLELEGPIEEVELLYQQMATEREGKIRATQDVLNETEGQIRTLDDHYRRTQECLRIAIDEAETKVRQHCADQIEWAAQSREHLEWTLEHAPVYTNDVVRRYTEHFPNDDVTNLLCPSAPTTIQERSSHKRNGQPKSSLPCPAAETVVEPTPAWRFWVTFKEDEEGKELSSEREKFLTDLRTTLREAGYPSLPTEKVYEQLTTVSGMETAQRQQIKKIIYGTELLGWKIVRAGREHRLFLFVDEVKRHIRFLPRWRKDSYKH